MLTSLGQGWEYLVADPLRVLYLIGGAGGLVYWWDRVRDRRRLAVRIMEDEPMKGGLTVEVTNEGSKATALRPLIRAKAYDVKRRRVRMDYDVQELERSLPPHAPRVLHATAREPDAGWGWTHLRVYTFRPTRGFRARVRIWSALLEDADRFSFWFWTVRFAWLGRGPRVSGRSISSDDYQRMRRSRGPHGPHGPDGEP